jgi:hypothetical protein
MQQDRRAQNFPFTNSLTVYNINNTNIKIITTISDWIRHYKTNLMVQVFEGLLHTMFVDERTADGQQNICRQVVYAP